MQKNTPLKDLISLDGKGAIVTGGAMAIGLAISHRLAEAGAAVLLADINAKEANVLRTARSQRKCASDT